MKHSEIAFINPNNGYYYYENDDGNFQTRGLTELCQEGILPVWHVDHIGVRTLDYCEKFYEKINN